MFLEFIFNLTLFKNHLLIILPNSDKKYLCYNNIELNSLCNSVSRLLVGTVGSFIQLWNGLYKPRCFMQSWNGLYKPVLCNTRWVNTNLSGFIQSWVGLYKTYVVLNKPR